MTETGNIANTPPSIEGKTTPFVSVIIPTYNRSAFLREAIKSIIRQEYPKDNFEILIVDNSSSDDTVETVSKIIFEFENSISISFILENRKGLVYARHSGAYRARGELLIFGDDDALYEKNWIAAITEMYNKNPDVGAVGTKILIKWDTPPEPWVSEFEGLMGKLDLGDQTIVNNNIFINGGSFSIRKKLLYQTKGFNPGQNGEYLLGDSESGLCRKLIKLQILIGWTPHTTMWHLQKAEKNGTLSDIKRRYFNNGIAEAYNTVFKYSQYRKFLQILLNFVIFIKEHLKLFILLLITKNHEKVIRLIIFENAFYRGYLRYLFLYSFDKKIKTEISKKDWEFSNNYSAPEILLKTN